LNDSVTVTGSSKQLLVIQEFWKKRDEMPEVFLASLVTFLEAEIEKTQEKLPKELRFPF
jgi:hypothetical protein